MAKKEDDESPLAVWESLKDGMIGYIFRFDNKKAEDNIVLHFGNEFKDRRFFWILKAELTFQGDQKPEMKIVSGKMDVSLRQTKDEPFCSTVKAMAISDDNDNDLFEIIFTEGETRGRWSRITPKSDPNHDQ